jgi:alkylation response protein AidB-like acyl-CoA dehydrogenase
MVISQRQDLLIFNKDMGVEIAKKEVKLGIRASSTCSLNFDDIQVPKENILHLFPLAPADLHSTWK